MSSIIQFRTVAPTWLGDLIDELGEVNAQIANLEKRKAELRQGIIDSEESAAEGDLFRATVSRSEAHKVDWKTVAEKCEPSRQLIAAHTSVEPRIVVKVVSR